MLNEDQMLNLKPRRKAQEWRGWYQKNGARMQSGGGKFICMATKIYRGDGSNHRRLQGKVAIITGAGSRIGEAIAHNFAKGGARSSCAGRRMPSARRRFIEFFPFANMQPCWKCQSAVRPQQDLDSCRPAVS